MAINEFIQLNGKKYAVMADGWEPVTSRQRSIDVGLTGKTIIQDFTNPSRKPKSWNYRLKVFVNDPFPDATWGVFDDLLAAFEQLTVPFVEHDDSISHTVTLDGDITPQPRVPAAAISGTCNEVYYVPVRLVKVY